MITLYIDTSSSDVSIAILRDNKIIDMITKVAPNKHSEMAVELLDEVLNRANISSKDVDRVMVVTGPGSFTGLRIGVTIAKVFAYVLDVGIIEISSLRQRAISIVHDNCLSLIDAHHDNYYMGLYDKDNEIIIEEQFINKDRLLEIIKEYNPMIVSEDDYMIDDISCSKIKLDIEKIASYYSKMEPKISHLVNPNYLKLPQVLEND